MNQQFEQNCPFQGRQYDFLTDSDNYIEKGRGKPTSSFAEYVHGLKEGRQGKIRRQHTEIIKKSPTLPRIDPVIPELQKMNDHFVLSMNKNVVGQQCLGNQASTPRCMVHMPLSITRKSVNCQKQIKLSPITSKSAVCIAQFISI